jgi:hypothetical protein
MWTLMLLNAGLTITWETVVGSVAVLGVVCGANAMYVNYSISRAVDNLFLRLNGRYVRSELCTERHADHGRRLDCLEER